MSLKSSRLRLNYIKSAILNYLVVLQLVWAGSEIGSLFFSLLTGKSIQVRTPGIVTLIYCGLPYTTHLNYAYAPFRQVVAMVSFKRFCNLGCASIVCRLTTYIWSSHQYYLSKLFLLRPWWLNSVSLNIITVEHCCQIEQFSRENYQVWLKTWDKVVKKLGIFHVFMSALRKLASRGAEQLAFRGAAVLPL